MESIASVTSPSSNSATGQPSALKIRPSPSTSSPPATTSPLTPSSFTSKEWIVPPRPKPGRKPATDTPPTKRKAQNRAAQRAFRERRAARVGELEEQIQQIEEQDNREIKSLQNTVEGLERELQVWMEKYRTLERRVEYEKDEKERLALNFTTVSDVGQAEAEPLFRSQTANRFKSPDLVTTHDQLASSNVPPGCGNCSLDSRCQCLEEVIEGAHAVSRISKESTSNSLNSANAKSTEPETIKAEPIHQGELETDFTTYHAQNARPAQDGDIIMASPGTSPSVTDPCGFCTDGTPCVCAQMAAEDDQSVSRKTGLPPSTSSTNPKVTSGASSALTPRPRFHQQNSQQFTPPPSETDVMNPCTNGPGTCAQCLADPASTLFCKSLAASRAQSLESSTNTNCCGSRDKCKRAQRDTGHRPTISSPLRLSCADAYTTLSRHQAFQKARQDIDSWMPKLAAESSTTDERHPMEIEAASIMSLLSEFDRRFPRKTEDRPKGF